MSSNSIYNNIAPPVIEQKTPTRVFALGGLDEIGKNTYCIEHDNELIIIDAGVKFPQKNMVRLEAIIPNYEYLIENNYKIKALFITHGHEDHIGGIPYLLTKVKVPIIYAPCLAAALIRDRLSENKLKNRTIVKEYTEKTLVKSHNFTMNFFPVNHSIPDAYGIVVNTPNGQIVTTGDFKFDLTPIGHEINFNLLSRIRDKKVKLLLSDSTNSEVPGYVKTEKQIINNISQIIKNCPGRVMFSTFASNVHRIQQVIEIAATQGRKIMVFGRSIERIINIIRKLGHLKISNSYFLNKKGLDDVDPTKILILCTGSQGEEKAVLARVVNNEHPWLKVQKNDTFIFASSAIPGNKANVEQLVNKLMRQQATVYQNSVNNPIHTSGHASQEEQKWLIKLLNPQFFMPMHGDFRMLKKHIETAVSVGVSEENAFLCSNGDVLSILGDKVSISERVPAENVFIDIDKNISLKTKNIVYDRQTLSCHGLIVVIVSIDFKNKTLLGTPHVISRGTFYVQRSGYIITNSINITREAVRTVFEKPRPSFGKLKSMIKNNLAPYIYKVKKRNPIIVPVILDKQTQD